MIEEEMDKYVVYVSGEYLIIIRRELLLALMEPGGGITQLDFEEADLT